MAWRVEHGACSSGERTGLRVQWLRASAHVMRVAMAAGVAALLCCCLTVNLELLGHDLDDGDWLLSGCGRCRSGTVCDVGCGGVCHEVWF